MNLGKILAPRFACSDYGGDAQQDHTEFGVNSSAVEATPATGVAWLHDEHHAVFQVNLSVVYQHVAISFLDEKHFEEVGLEHFMLRKHPRALASISCINVDMLNSINLVKQILSYLSCLYLCTHI